MTPPNQAVNAAFVEALNPTGQCPSGNDVKSRNLIVSNSQQQSLDPHHTNMTPLGSPRPCGSLQFRQRAVLSIGHVRSARHARGKSHSPSDREKNPPAIGQKFWQSL